MNLQDVMKSILVTILKRLDYKIRNMLRGRIKQRYFASDINILKICLTTLEYCTLYCVHVKLFLLMIKNSVINTSWLSCKKSKYFVASSSNVFSSQHECERISNKCLDCLRARLCDTGWRPTKLRPATSETCHTSSFEASRTLAVSD